jgi:hypothetical protein
MVPFKCSPHVPGRRLQADVRRVLERGLVLGQDGLLTNHTSPAHGLQGPAQGEDPPVALAKLYNLLTEILKADAIAPLEQELTEK